MNFGRFSCDPVHYWMLFVNLKRRIFFSRLLIEYSDTSSITRTIELESISSVSSVVIIFARIHICANHNNLYVDILRKKMCKVYEMNIVEKWYFEFEKNVALEIQISFTKKWFHSLRWISKLARNNDKINNLKKNKKIF